MNRSNPSLGDNVFGQFRGMGYASAADRMSISGTINKSLFLVIVAIATAAFSWTTIASNPSFGNGLILLGAIAGFGLAILTIYKPEFSPYSSPAYAAAEGIVLGGVSAAYSQFYGGIVAMAVPLTLAILFLMLGLYRAGILRATPVFTRALVIATLGICIVYGLNFVMMMFGGGISLHQLGGLGILISLVICGVAAMNFILDFDFIERGAEQGAPKYMEWYGAFSICVTLFWLYLEVLRLISLLSDSRR